MLFPKNKFKTNDNKTKREVTFHNSNYLRSKYITALTSSLELFMLVTYLFQYEKYPEQYRMIYLLMYIFLFVVSLAGFCVLTFNKKLVSKPKTINAFVLVFSEIYLLWGAGITILDNLLYAQIIVFVTNLMFCSTAFIIRPKTFIKIVLPPVALMFIVFPYIESSAAVLVGNYINLVIIIFAATMNNYLQYSLFKEQDLQKEKLKQISEYDELTTLHNRRSLNKFINDYTLESKKESLGVLMMDIDYFKKYNDCYGHIAGDLAICEVGNITNIFATKDNGFAARYGGEEFIVIFENISCELLYSISENIRKEIRNKNIRHNASLCDDRLSVSIGIYYTSLPPNNLWDAIKYADDALFQAKNNGRNQIDVISKIKNKEASIH